MRWLLRWWRNPPLPAHGLISMDVPPPVGNSGPLTDAETAPREPRGEIIGYEVAGKLYHPDDVLIVRAAP